MNATVAAAADDDDDDDVSLDMIQLAQPTQSESLPAGQSPHSPGVADCCRSIH